jgi:hypothetical protein
MENKSVQFTMERIFDAKQILLNFEEHNDNFGHWSKCKKLENNVTLTLCNNLIQNDPQFIDELIEFAKYHDIQINFIWKNKFIIENSTEEKISKIMFFINDDLIILNEFAFLEIKNDYKYSFLNGKSIHEYGEENRVHLALNYYFKKLHLYGTPERRKIVKDMITEYMDNLNNSLRKRIFEIPHSIPLKSIFRFLDSTKNEFYSQQV